METESNMTEDPGKDKVEDKSELGRLLAHYYSIVSNKIPLQKIVRNVVIVFLILAGAIFIFSWFFFIIPGFQEIGTGKISRPDSIAELRNDPSYKKQISQLAKETQKLSRKFAAYTPGQSYLVINTTENKFSLYRNKVAVREGFCSTGSYTKLVNTTGSKQWIFKTPKGQFWIQQKITSPLWVRPDWSFVEEGLPIPPPNDESRYEYGVLGDYAMAIGDGYLIHGTLYKRLLRMPVTHGCVRLNDEDLETIYNTLNIGSKVFIF
jgi:hypothetical protein